MKKGLRWKLDNGKNISLWTYNWMDDKSIKEIVGKHEIIVNGETRVSNFIKEEKNWDMN